MGAFIEVVPAKETDFAGISSDLGDIDLEESECRRECGDPFRPSGGPPEG